MDEVLNKYIIKEYEYEIKEFEKTINTGHILLLSPDPKLVSKVLELSIKKIIKSPTNNFIKTEEIYSIKQNIEKDIIYLLNLDNKNERELNKILYYYFELKHKMFLVMISSRVDCVDEMEKRVRSRFNNNVIMIKSMNKEFFNFLLNKMIEYRNTTNYIEKENIMEFENNNSGLKITKISAKKERSYKSSKQNKKICRNKDISGLTKNEKNIEKMNAATINYTLKNQDYNIDSLEDAFFMIENKIEESDTDFLYDILTPIHIIIMIISTRNKVEYNTIVSMFRKFTMGINEIGMVRDEDIISSFLDCKKTGLILNRSFFGDTFGFFDYVKTKSPLYIKNMLEFKRKL